MSSGDLGGVAGVLRALAEARWTSFEKLYFHATLRWPYVKPTVKLSLLTHNVKTASTVHLILSVPRQDGTEISWNLDVWIGPEVVSATGAVYAQQASLIVDRHFDRTEEATEAAGAAELIRSMASRVCAERRFLES